ncbi:hypothetical protein NPIL_223211 [Nephila pilipes]|uniref:Uncharacterized protein n=1 Tax=Nephila pilipes TaxID=299642 RepID=A0A8X6IQC1_NEPPI|nr:hypothetical protein NPIL_223211 [Nephila pilipes]
MGGPGSGKWKGGKRDDEDESQKHLLKVHLNSPRNPFPVVFGCVASLPDRGVTVQFPFPVVRSGQWPNWTEINSPPLESRDEAHAKSGLCFRREMRYYFLGLAYFGNN